MAVDPATLTTPPTIPGATCLEFSGDSWDDATRVNTPPKRCPVTYALTLQAYLAYLANLREQNRRAYVQRLARFSHTMKGGTERSQYGMLAQRQFRGAVAPLSCVVGVLAGHERFRGMSSRGSTA